MTENDATIAAVEEGTPNRVVAGPLGTLVSLVSGIAAAWLLRHFPGLGLDPDSTTQAVAFVLGTAVAELGRQKWLAGWQKFEARHHEEATEALRFATDYLMAHGSFPPGYVFPASDPPPPAVEGDAKPPAA